MWIGALALAGVPPFSGFFSKDQILADALARGDWVGYTVWGLGLAGALVTALYTFRLMLLVFHGPPSDYARRHGEAHAGHGEGPLSMLWTVGVLAVGALVAGLLEIPQVTHGMRDFLEPTVPGGLEATGAQELGTSALAVALALVGLFAAHVLWGRRSDTPRRIAAATAPAERVLRGQVRLRPPLRLGLLPAGRGARAAAAQRLWEDGAVLGSMNVVSSASARGRAGCSRRRSPASCASTRSPSRSASPRSPPGSSRAPHERHLDVHAALAAAARRRARSCSSCR